MSEREKFLTSHILWSSCLNPPPVWAVASLAGNHDESVLLIHHEQGDKHSKEVSSTCLLPWCLVGHLTLPEGHKRTNPLFSFRSDSGKRTPYLSPAVINPCVEFIFHTHKVLDPLATRGYSLPHVFVCVCVCVCKGEGADCVRKWLSFQ